MRGSIPDVEVNPAATASDPTSTQSFPERILRFWMDIEALAPAPVVRSMDKGAGSFTLKSDRDDRTWEERVVLGDHASRRDSIRSHVVSIGLFSRSRAMTCVLGHLGVEQEQQGRHEDAPKNETCHLATFVVDARDGSMVRGSFTPTVLCLRYPMLVEGVQCDPRALRRQAFSIRDRMDNAFCASEGDEARPLRPVDLGRMVADLASISRIDFPIGGTSSAGRCDCRGSIALASFTPVRTRPELAGRSSPDRQLFDDIASVGVRTNGAPVGPLGRYLSASTGDRHDLGEIDHGEPLLDLDLVPPVRWPSRGAHGPALALRQQIAVNAAWQGANPILGVNGPPGTGKTTLLKDLVAGAIFRRAEAVAGLRDPGDLFGHAVDVATSQGRTLRTWVMNEAVRGHGVVVTSTNNAAVENVTLDLPSEGAVAGSWREDETFMRDLDLHRSIVGEGSWGTAAAALGNRANVAAFMRSYWHGHGPDVRVVDGARLHRRTGTGNEKGSRPSGVTFRDGSRYLRAFLSEERMADLETSGAGDVYTLFVREDGQFDRIVDFENNGAMGSIRGELRRGATIVEWREAVTEFHQALSDVEALRSAMRELNRTPDRIEAQSKMVASTRERHGIAVDHMRSASSHLAGMDREIADLRASIESQVTAMQGLLALRPGLLARVLGTASARRWKVDLETLTSAIATTPADLDRLVRRRRSHGDIVLEARREAEAVTLALQDQERSLASMRRRLEAARMAVPPDLIRPAMLDELDAVDREISCPWTTSVFDRARERLFSKSVRLCVISARAASAKMLDNLQAHFVLVHDRSRSRSDDPREPWPGDVVRSLWDTFFMTVPVVSTTFQSMGPLFGDAMGEASIGLLLVDEAGQASPQAAVGALWRARKAVIVGDPFQIDPVVQMPLAASRAMALRYGIPLDDLVPGVGSVQAAADRVTVHGAEIGGRWVGCPLRVHRRCSSPMFEISNRISYEGTMVQGRPAPDRSSWPDVIPEYGPGRQSRWLDLVSYEQREKWPTELGVFMGEVLSRIFQDLPSARRLSDRDGLPLFRNWIGPDGLPDVFFVTPFRDVRDGMRRVARSKMELAVAALVESGQTPDADFRERYSRWVDDHVGTVHTFQGREAQTVFLVLGCVPGQEGSVRWAGERPNLLNVAATRARSTFYVVGDHALWSGSAVTFSGLEADLPIEHVRVMIPRVTLAVPEVGRIEHLTTVPHFLRTLSQAFSQAQERILLASPFVSSRVLSDRRCDVPRLIRSAVDRGVAVSIHVDPDFNAEAGVAKTAYRDGVALLRASGALVNETRGMHTKVLCVDDTMIVEGSFNWLSANRDVDGDRTRLDTGMVLSGTSARECVDRAWKLLDDLNRDEARSSI